MVRATPGDPAAPPDPLADAPLDDAVDIEEAASERPSLEGLSIAGITRRRAAFAIGALVSIWVIAVFARQVGDASAATARADLLRSQNATTSADVAALQAELQLIQTQPYVQQQARAYGLGTPLERPFALAGGAPPLPSNAPGSAALRLGADERQESPLEAWLSMLFGPGSSQ